MLLLQIQLVEFPTKYKRDIKNEATINISNMYDLLFKNQDPEVRVVNANEIIRNNMFITILNIVMQL